MKKSLNNKKNNILMIIYVDVCVCVAMFCRLLMYRYSTVVCSVIGRKELQWKVLKWNETPCNAMHWNAMR